MANTDTSQFHNRGSRIPRPMAYLALALVVAGAAALWLRPDGEIAPLASIDRDTNDNTRGQIEGVASQAVTEQAGTGVSSSQPAESAEPPPMTESIIAKTPAVEPEQPRTGITQARASDDSKTAKTAGSGPSVQLASTVTSPNPAKESAPGAEPLAPLAGNVTTSASIPTEGKAAYDLDWLRKQEPASYVIQLVGTRSAAAAGKFVDEHKLGSRGAWILTSHENKPWYVVVYGMYPDNGSAKAAIKTLPEPLRAGSPWPRRVSSVVENAR